MRPVTVVAGRAAPLRQLVIDEIIGQWTFPSVERLDAGEIPLRSLLIRLSQPVTLAKRELIIYSGIDTEFDSSILDGYLDRPTSRLTLILEAGEIRGKSGQRVIPSDDRVLYIDCSYLDEKNLVRFARLSGLTEPDAEWLVAQACGDMGTIIRTIDLLYVFDQPWPAGLVQRVFQGGGTNRLYFDRFAIQYTSDTSLCRQLKNRFVQLGVMSDLIKERMAVPDIGRRADVEPYIVARLYGLAKAHTSLDWLKAMGAVVGADRYVQYGMSGVPEYLRAVLAEA